MELRPTHDRVLCRVLPVETLTKGGLILPEAAQGRPNKAEVIKTGPGGFTPSGDRVEPQVKPGDVVLFDAYKIDWVVGEAAGVGTPSAKPGDLFLIREEHLQGVLEED